MTSRPTTRFVPEHARGLTQQAPVPVKCVVVAGPDAGLERPLDGTLRVGTADGCGLQLKDIHVSRSHAAFEAREGRVFVRDLGSLNGTYLGGARIVEGETPVGAVVYLGSVTAIAVQPRWHVREVAPSTNGFFGEMVGGSMAMREAFAILERVSPTDVAILLEGETGVGKEVAARSIHGASARTRGPYVVFDCGSVPRELAESELFGHRKGAFSGAVSDRAGAFQRASGGTIFLDEIGELPIDLQPKLLRVLETGEVRAVGDDLVRKVDVRVIAATNRDLHAEAARGNFRQDLLYRLDVVRVRIPPLRHRPEDIPLLLTRLLHGRIDPSAGIGGDNLARLLAYAWPGNVRELRNTLLRAVTLAPRSSGALPRFSDLVVNLGPAAHAPATFGMSFPGVTSHLPFKEAKEQLLASFERAYVEALMARHDGSVTRAAAAAALSRKHLYELIRKTTGEALGDDTGSSSVPPA